MPPRTGSTNRNKQFLLKRLQDMYGEDFHPIMKMAENAVEMQRQVDEDDSLNSRKLAIEAWDKVAQYTEPKLKSIEVTDERDTALLTEEALLERASAARERFARYTEH